MDGVVRVVPKWNGMGAHHLDGWLNTGASFSGASLQLHLGVRRDFVPILVLCTNSIFVVVWPIKG